MLNNTEWMLWLHIFLCKLLSICSHSHCQSHKQKKSERKGENGEQRAVLLLTSMGRGNSHPDLLPPAFKSGASIESQHTWGFKGLLDVTWSHPCSSSDTRAGCPGLRSRSFWRSPRRRSHSLWAVCAPSVTAQKCFLVFKGKLLYSRLYLLFLVLSVSTTERAWLHLHYIVPSSIYLYWWDQMSSLVTKQKCWYKNSPL